MKIKITSANATQQNNVITKCRNWGAAARDGVYSDVPGKTAVVVNTKLGAGIPAIQLSRVDFIPTKSPYDSVMSYKDFMNLTVCPWGAVKGHKHPVDTPTNIGTANAATRVEVREVRVEVPVPVEVGVCSQETLQVSSCSVLTQEKIAWNTLGLPFLKDNGVTVTMDGDDAYILDTKKNTAKPLTAKLAAKRAKKDLLNHDITDSPWISYGKTFNLFENVQLSKVVDVEDED